MDTDIALMGLGAVFILGLGADVIGRRVHVPRVTLLLLIGVAIGPGGFDVLPSGFAEWYEFLSAAALTVVAFLLGNSLTPERLGRHGRRIMVVSVMAVAGSILVVGTGLVALGAPLQVALVLAGIATATDPAATYDVIRQAEAEGDFPELILGIVAVDDAWGLIAFALLLIAARTLGGDPGLEALVEGGRDLAGSILLGVAVGLPAAFLTGRIRPGEPMQAEGLAVVFLCAGLAIRLDLSFLLAGMVAGATVANLARHHERAFHEIERMEWPFMLLFFVLAGAEFELADLKGAVWLTVAFVVLRIAARLIFGWAGGWLGGLPTDQRTWIGAALMPQAGVAVGMALVAGEQFPEHRETVIAATLATTIVFEILGPFATMAALRRTGSTRAP